VLETQNALLYIPDMAYRCRVLFWLSATVKTINEAGMNERPSGSRMAARKAVTKLLNVKTWCVRPRELIDAFM